MARWPFLGPRADGLREEDEEVVVLRDFMVPWAIGFAGGGLGLGLGLGIVIVRTSAAVLVD